MLLKGDALKKLEVFQLVMANRGVGSAEVLRAVKSSALSADLR